MITIEEGKQFLRENYKKGTKCPCCKQFVKLYKRKISSSMAYALILVYKNQTNNNVEWTHIQNYLKPLPIPAPILSCGYSLLIHWGLIEAKDEKKEDGNPNSGFYKVTQKGIDFVLNRIMVPESCFLLRFKPQAWSESQVTIYGALKNKFNYNELML